MKNFLRKEEHHSKSKENNITFAMFFLDIIIQQSTTN